MYQIQVRVLVFVAVVVVVLAACIVLCFRALFVGIFYVVESCLFSAFTCETFSEH